MTTGRFSLLLSTVTILLSFSTSVPAEAFWGFGQDSGVEKSGLDLTGGYDRNTVTTVSGTVVSTKLEADHSNAMITIREGDVAVHLVVGPLSYWSENGITITPGDELTARGSKAQGKDGGMYLQVQRLKDKTTGNEVILRDESGRPFWAGTSGRRDGSRDGAGRMNRNGSPMRHNGARMGHK